MACERITLFVEAVVHGTGEATIRGEVWIEPIDVGDVFTEVSYWDHADVVSVQVTDISEVPDAQEIGRTSRVVVVLRGAGLERVQPNTVLIGLHD